MLQEMTKLNPSCCVYCLLCTLCNACYPQFDANSPRPSGDDCVEGGAYGHVMCSIWKLNASFNRRCGYQIRHEPCCHGRWIWISIHPKTYIMTSFLLTSPLSLSPSLSSFPPLIHTRFLLVYYWVNTDTWTDDPCFNPARTCPHGPKDSLQSRERNQEPPSQPPGYHRELPCPRCHIRPR